MWEARARKVKLRTDTGHELGDGSRWEDLRSIWLMQSAVRTCRSGRRQGEPGEDSDRNSSTTGTGQPYQSGTPREPGKVLLDTVRGIYLQAGRDTSAVQGVDGDSRASEVANGTRVLPLGLAEGCTWPLFWKES